jgi:prophage antirepressor-like protein
MELMHQQFGTIRIAENGGQYWFCAKDVCNALELDNVSMALQKLDDDEKGIKNFDTPGGPQEMLVVNESGLYALILRSNKPQARAFRKWVTNEVLPSLRRTGKYEIKTPRQIERENERAYNGLLKELRKDMRFSDVSILARRSRIDEEAISRVLNGHSSNAVILNEIIVYVLKKKGLERLYQTSTGIDKVMRLLQGQLDNLQLTD